MPAGSFYYEIHSRILMEKLTLKRNPTDYQSYIETFRESLVDANPHQIESVVFALEKLESGGCILADETGLGKTIEAGLVISQYRAMRKFKILILVPTSLAGQWNNELRKLFQIPSLIISTKDRAGKRPEEFMDLLGNSSVCILGREFASRLEKEKILSKINWDLIIIDEAHEIFASIYKRFSPRTGEYLHDSRESATAGYLFGLLKRTPLLILTATPIQNNLFELWGLSSFILPEYNKSYLGQFNHFRELFIQNNEILIDKIPELKERTGNFMIRNLRNQAQVFMDYKFTMRECHTLNFHMSDEEKSIYNSISNYFDRDDIFAYSPNGIIDLKNEKRAGLRTLLKLSYRRTLGSSFKALASSLNSIIERLENMKSGVFPIAGTFVETDDPGNDEEDRISTGINVGGPDNLNFDDETAGQSFSDKPDISGIEEEINLVRSFIDLAGEISVTGKDELILNTLKDLFNNKNKFYQKAVIFTTYRATQQHIRDIFENDGEFINSTVLFSGGGGKTEREKADIEEAVRIWKEEAGNSIPEDERPSGEALERTALVYLFKIRKKLFISTEAGAKGLNLQFCNIIINYDLPWNPQRIEQRIGRCHRYGQERDVLVVNCINADNETEKRIHEILSGKFDLFRNVLGAGDDILGTLSKAINFEARVNDILNTFKTEKDRLDQLQRFEEEISDEIKKLRNEKLIKARGLLNDLDPNVKNRLKNIREKLPKAFSQYDKDMLELLKNYAASSSKIFEETGKTEDRIFFRFDNENYYLGKIDEFNITDCRHISLKSGIVSGVMNKIKGKTDGICGNIEFDYSNSPEKSGILKPYLNCRGKWDFFRVNFCGLEEEEVLYDIIVIERENGLYRLTAEESAALKRIEFNLRAEFSNPVSSGIIEFLEDTAKKDEIRIQECQQPRLDKKLHNLEIELKDREDYIRNQLNEAQVKISELDKKIRTTTSREDGQKLIKEREILQKRIAKHEEDILDFKRDFRKIYDEEENNLISKRFIDKKAEKIFSLDFIIR